VARTGAGAVHWDARTDWMGAHNVGYGFFVIDDGLGEIVEMGMP
jgi:hypothetical protein